MFYSGGAYGEVDAPPGLPGVSEGTSIKGLKSRPGLAMSQARNGKDQFYGCCLCIVFPLLYFNQSCPVSLKPLLHPCSYLLQYNGLTYSIPDLKQKCVWLQRLPEAHIYYEVNNCL